MIVPLGILLGIALFTMFTFKKDEVYQTLAWILYVIVGLASVVSLHAGIMF